MKRRKKAPADAGMKEFIERWRRAGPLLERVRREELRHFDFQKNWKIVDSLLQLGCDHGEKRTTSGLLEFQRLLARSRR